MRPLLVVVLGVGLERPIPMSTTKDQRSVQTLSPNGRGEAFLQERSRWGRGSERGSRASPSERKASSNGPVGHSCVNGQAAQSGRLTLMRSHRYACSHPASRSAFGGYRFPREVITLAVPWYLRFGLSYWDVEELLPENLASRSDPSHRDCHRPIPRSRGSEPAGLPRLSRVGS